MCYSDPYQTDHETKKSKTYRLKNDRYFLCFFNSKYLRGKGLHFCIFFDTLFFLELVFFSHRKYILLLYFILWYLKIHFSMLFYILHVCDQPIFFKL